MAQINDQYSANCTNKYFYMKNGSRYFVSCERICLLWEIHKKQRYSSHSVCCLYFLVQNSMSSHSLCCRYVCRSTSWAAGIYRGLLTGLNHAKLCFVGVFCDQTDLYSALGLNRQHLPCQTIRWKYILIFFLHWNLLGCSLQPEQQMPLNPPLRSCEKHWFDMSVLVTFENINVYFSEPQRGLTEIKDKVHQQSSLFPLCSLQRACNEVKT